MYKQQPKRDLIQREPKQTRLVLSPYTHKDDMRFHLGLHHCGHDFVKRKPRQLQSLTLLREFFSIKSNVSEPITLMLPVCVDDKKDACLCHGITSGYYCSTVANTYSAH